MLWSLKQLASMLNLYVRYQGIMRIPTEHVVVMFDEYDNDAENKYSNVYSPSYFVKIKQQ
jgi:hypothetical protein